MLQACTLYLVNTVLKESVNDIVNEMERRPNDGPVIRQEPFGRLGTGYFLDQHENMQDELINPVFKKLGIYHFYINTKYIIYIIY